MDKFFNAISGYLGNLTGKKELASPMPKGATSADVFKNVETPSYRPVQPPTLANNPDQVVGLVQKYFPEDPKTAQAIFTHESQLGKVFQNSQGAPAYGVAQIYLPAHRKIIPGSSDAEKIDYLRNPDNNLKIARQIYDDAKKRTGNGFTPWESYTTKRYTKYLAQ